MYSALSTRLSNTEFAKFNLHGPIDDFLTLVPSV